MKLPIALAITSLIAGCGPVHVGVAEYQASRQDGDKAVVAEQPTPAVSQGGQDDTTHPPVPRAFTSPSGSMAARAVPPEPDAGGDGLARPHTVSQSQVPDGVVAVRQIDAATLRLGAWVSFNEVFRQGQVPAGSKLVAQIGEREVPVEMAVQSKYPDGSIRSSTITTAAGDVSEIFLLRR